LNRSKGPEVSYFSGPLKKDGTPDMRYAINKKSEANNSFNKTIFNNSSKCNNFI